MFIVEMTSTPPEPKKQVMLNVAQVQPPEAAPEVHKAAQSAHPKVGRNETCPCGSGLPRPATRTQAA